MALRCAAAATCSGLAPTASLTRGSARWLGKPEVVGTAEEIAQGLDASAWQRLSAGEGTKSPRLCDWAYLKLADLEADEFNPDILGNAPATLMAQIACCPRQSAKNR